MPTRTACACSPGMTVTAAQPYTHARRGRAAVYCPPHINLYKLTYRATNRLWPAAAAADSITTDDNNNIM